MPQRRECRDYRRQIDRWRAGASAAAGGGGRCGRQVFQPPAEVGEHGVDGVRASAVPMGRQQLRQRHPAAWGPAYRLLDQSVHAHRPAGVEEPVPEPGVSVANDLVRGADGGEPLRGLLRRPAADQFQVAGPHGRVVGVGRQFKHLIRVGHWRRQWSCRSNN